jgi:Helix-turn-helix domain
LPRTHDAKGRSLTKGRFALLPEDVLLSRAYCATSPVARALLVELAYLFTGSNNGSLGLSARQAAERLGCSKDTAARAFRELQEHGLIEVRRIGKFTTKTAPLASEWALSWRPCNRTNRLASNAFRNWHKAGPAEQPRKIAGPISRPVRSDLRDSNPD